MLKTISFWLPAVRPRSCDQGDVAFNMCEYRNNFIIILPTGLDLQYIHINEITTSIFALFMTLSVRLYANEYYSK